MNRTTKLGLIALAVGLLLGAVVDRVIITIWGPTPVWFNHLIIRLGL